MEGAMAWRSWSSTSSRESFCGRVIASRRAANPFRDGLFVLSNFAHAFTHIATRCCVLRFHTHCDSHRRARRSTLPFGTHSRAAKVVDNSHFAFRVNSCRVSRVPGSGHCSLLQHLVSFLRGPTQARKICSRRVGPQFAVRLALRFALRTAKVVDNFKLTLELTRLQPVDG